MSENKPETKVRVTNSTYMQLCSRLVYVFTFVYVFAFVYAFMFILVSYHQRFVSLIEVLFNPKANNQPKKNTSKSYLRKRRVYR